MIARGELRALGEQRVAPGEGVVGDPAGAEDDATDVLRVDRSGLAPGRRAPRAKRAETSASIGEREKRDRSSDFGVITTSGRRTGRFAWARKQVEVLRGASSAGRR